MEMAGQKRSWLAANRTALGLFLLMLLLPFAIALADGQAPAGVLASETGNAKFVQGLLIELLILAIYAISYDLILGITGLLSFGHAMFFATGAYATGIAFKSLEWGVGPTLLLVVAVGILQALLFSLVLPRVKGVTFALVTLGLASVFHIVIQASELAEYTGADVGLQGVTVPAWLSTSDQRYGLYALTLFVTLLVYLAYQRFVDSPTGRVCIAIRENEERALMLGYNTFHYKLAVLLLSSLTAALAGFLHTIHQPIVSPNVASLGWTVAALLIILIGGVGTLSGAIVGAATYRLLQYFLDRWFGEASSFLLGAVYVGLVIFLPYGIVGTWRLRQWQLREGRDRLRGWLTRQVS
ncbi:MAG: branched-chain amino acid ABC transporter permease [Anaerolineales bacterium]|nr:branched-chain amino acid ABC transporter permease [Anaerolineales bacterium]MCB8958766.1 branched-chain amino acid ABC transporter permease [Ardenticatenales bacterium]